MSIRNTSNDHPFVNMLFAMGASGEGIEAQEKQGQDQLARSSQLPVKCNDHKFDAKYLYSGLGFEIKGESPGDRLFFDVVMPDGWKIEATDHSMWSNLVSPGGNIRATIFYKAAFYDRDAFINAKCRYHTSFNMKEGDNESWRYTIVDAQSGESLFEQPWAAYGVASDRHGLCKDWLRENFPDFENPLAYWND